MRFKNLACFLLLFLMGCDGTSILVPTLTLAPTIALPVAPTSRPTTVPTSTQTALPAASPTHTLPPATATPVPAVLIGAGDIAYCGNEPGTNGDEKTSALLDSLVAQYPNAVIFTLGDTVYGDGTTTELKQCFDPNWGRFKDRIRPAPGNHDYMTDAGAPYFNYFGAAAGTFGQGYYSYDLGDWHIVVLNSNCNDIACGPNSEQMTWFREDLQKSGKQCTLAYWHHPRFSSGIAGGSSSVNAFWTTAVEMGVDVVVNGHDHDYERFAPMDASGNADPNGTREFVDGTGGAVLRDWGTIKPNSEVRYSSTYGVLKFELTPGKYEWTFLPVTDSAKTDNGTGTCH